MEGRPWEVLGPSDVSSSGSFLNFSSSIDRGSFSLPLSCVSASRRVQLGVLFCLIASTSKVLWLNPVNCSCPVLNIYIYICVYIYSIFIYILIEDWSKKYFCSWVSTVCSVCSLTTECTFQSDTRSTEVFSLFKWRQLSLKTGSSLQGHT